MPKVVLIIFALIITVTFGYLAGSFSKGFDLNLCYSNVLSNIEIDIKHAVETKEISDLLEIKNKLKLLPNHGYESNCEEINRMYIPAKDI